MRGWAVAGDGDVFEQAGGVQWGAGFEVGAGAEGEGVLGAGDEAAIFEVMGATGEEDFDTDAVAELAAEVAGLGGVDVGDGVIIAPEEAVFDGGLRGIVGAEAFVEAFVGADLGGVETAAVAVDVEAVVEGVAGVEVADFDVAAGAAGGDAGGSDGPFELGEGLGGADVEPAGFTVDGLPGELAFGHLMGIGEGGVEGGGAVHALGFAIEDEEVALHGGLGEFAPVEGGFDLFPAIGGERVGSGEGDAVAFDGDARVVAQGDHLAIDGACGMKVNDIAGQGEVDSGLDGGEGTFGGAVRGIDFGLGIDVPVFG